MNKQIKNDNWLSQYAKNIFSQHGEDGIIEKIFDVLNISQGWCVEFGAWDGKKYSNTYHLLSECSWSGVLIEGDKNRYLDLKHNFASNDDVYCINQYVGFDPHDCLDTILKKLPIPTDFELLSIDIDGNDYHVWESVRAYRPKVVIIEHNQTIPNHVEFVQPRDRKINQSSSLCSIVKLAKEKGYELVSTTLTNGIFVREDLYPLFEINNNQLDNLRKDTENISYLFQLLDGTIVLSGNKKLLWSGIPIREDKLQIVPRPLRYFRSSNRLKKLSRNLWRFLYTRKII